MAEEKTLERPQFFSDTLVTLIGEELANKVVDQICRGLTQTPPHQPSTSLCLEIIVFELDKDILQNIVKCTFAQLNPVIIAQEILKAFRHINHYMNGNQKPLTSIQSAPVPDATPPEPPPVTSHKLSICKFELLQAVVNKLHDLRTTLFDCDLQKNLFEKILLHPTQLPPGELQDLYAVIHHVLIQQFREMLITQYDNFALKLCNKVSCVNSDIEFVSQQIKQLTINFPAAEKGIIEIADAAGSVAESFFSEKDDFNEIFDAVDEVAEAIEDLAKFYQIKLTQLQKLLALSTTGCPIPIQARVTLPSIPEVTPPPPIFPVIGVPGSIALTSPLSTS